jgi:flagellar motor switch protein FliG
MLGNSGLDAILSKSYKSRLGTRFTVSAQSTNLMSTASDQRIRHVAIVLQSLDATTSRGLLSQLPPAQSKLVRQAMVQMGTVTPQERAAAFQSMQGLLKAFNVQTSPERPANQELLSPAAALLASQSTSMGDHVELSPQAVALDHHQSDWQSGISGRSNPNGIDNWRHMPAEALAEILQGERPIVIATVMNQVSVARATAIAQALPINIAATTLAALPHLHLTDAAILEDIQLELERKIGQYQSPKQATEEGLTKLKAILACMPAVQHDTWTNAIAQSNPLLATKMGWNTRTSQTANGHPMTSVPTTQLDQRPRTTKEDIFDDSMILPFAPHASTSAFESAAVKSSTNEKQPIAPKSTLADRDKPTGKQAIEDLLQLSDRDFVAVLHACQPQTVLLALSGASRAFATRVERLVPAKDVKRLRDRLHSLGPLQLRDIDEAQTRIVETAKRLLLSGSIGATTSVTFTAAA